MKQKKFPWLPALLVVGIGTAAFLNANKPMVGDYATVQKHIADEQRKKNEKAPETSAPRQTVSSGDLAKGMKDALAEEKKPKGNMDRKTERKEPLIKHSVPKTQREATVNPAIPASGWFRDDYRGEKTNN
jgi:hypothetical protein